MKKTFTLLAIAAFLSSASFAQYDYGNSRQHPVVINDNRGNWGRGGYFFSPRERDMEIASINNEYGNRIESVRNRFFMSRSKKERIICSLQEQRDVDIHAVIEKFNSPANHFDGGYHDHDWRDNHDRKNNW